MQDKITFIIPSIGRMSLIQSVDSLLNQTNPNWECIIIFDGVDEYKFKDNRIKTIKIPKKGSNSPHHGMSGLVRNEGLKLCKTEWIGFLDDDDTIDSNYVNDLFSKYSDKDFVLWRMINKKGEIIPKLKDNIIKFGNVGISFCFKNRFPNLFFDVNRDGEDYDFLKKLTSLTANYVVTDKPYYNVGF